jgi:hypothetical protein
MKEFLKDILWLIGVVMVAGIIWIALVFVNQRLDDGAPIKLPPFFF